MAAKFQLIPGGTVTTPLGFSAGAVHSGIKTRGDRVLDLGILYSEVSCTAAGVLTTNKVKAAPVLVCQERLAGRKARAVVVNSGCANACTSEQGLADAREMTSLVAKKLNIPVNEVFVASTGVIGVPLPMARVRSGIERIVISRDGGHQLARAILTTDANPKQIAVTTKVGNTKITVGGIAKGAGMIFPNLATLLCFLTTDARLDPRLAEWALRGAVDASFNMISVDNDTSTNDTVLLMASGLAGNAPIRDGTAEADIFKAALQEVCVYLAKRVVRGGEGATRLIEARIEGAASENDARAAARAVVSSSLVKSAVHGADPNWGRILAAVGRSGAEVDHSRVDLYLDEINVLKAGCPVQFDVEKARRVLKQEEVPIRVNLNLGAEMAVAWGCDLSADYVAINSAYAT
ncbi:MAG: bifunctional glutamate N-acetyltransferase/amino-acid acetyltransferase ArgJ [Dehalococcoidia bacterium]|nr:bifunctional glutamate N-acetyltransferase/amino-acid acetyltransferase ArgJ [Dehalococcoidia bacterium]